MIHRRAVAGQAIVGLTLIATAAFALAAAAQAPPPAPPASSLAKQAIEARKAVFTLVGANYRPIGALLQGRVQYEAADVQKRVARIASLSEMAGDAFPDSSNSGLPGSKAKADIWTDRADFDKRLKDFQAHARELVQVNARERGATDAFKSATRALAQDCTGCHDRFREE